jgi:hypothetical protein
MATGVDAHSDIGPAERFVLWRGTDDGEEAFKIAFLSHVTRGFIRRERDGDKFFVVMVKPLDATASAIDRDVVSIVKDIDRSRMTDIVRAARFRHGEGMREFVWGVIAPVLVARGLATVDQAWFLGIFPGRRTLRPTPDGERLIRAVEHDVERARTIPALLREDRATALAIAIGVGAATFLLLPELREVHASIAGELEAQRAANQGGDGGGGDGGVLYAAGSTSQPSDDDDPDATALSTFDSAFAGAMSDPGSWPGDGIGAGGGSDGGGDGGGGGGGD